MRFWTSILKWAYKKNFASRNPAELWDEMITVVPPEPVFLNESEIKMLEAVYHSKALIGYRRPFEKNGKVRRIRYHRKLHDTLQQVLAAIFTGLRHSDLSSLHQDNQNGVEISITVQKTKRPLRFQLPKRLLAILETGGGSFFTVPKRTNEIFNKHLKLICEYMGIKKKITAHKLRHTFATYLLDLQVPLEVVQNLLGHSDIKSTMIYAHVTDRSRNAATARLDEAADHDDSPPPASPGGIIPSAIVGDCLAALPKKAQTIFRDQLKKRGYILNPIRVVNDQVAWFLEC